MNSLEGPSEDDLARVSLCGLACLLFHYPTSSPLAHAVWGLLLVQLVGKSVMYKLAMFIHFPLLLAQQMAIINYPIKILFKSHESGLNRPMKGGFCTPMIRYSTGHESLLDFLVSQVGLRAAVSWGHKGHFITNDDIQQSPYKDRKVFHDYIHRIVCSIFVGD